MGKDLSATADAAAATAQKEKKDRQRPTLASPTVNMPEDLRTPTVDIMMAESKSFAQLILPMLVTYLQTKGKLARDYKLDLSKARGGGGFVKLKADNAAKDEEIAKLKAELAKAQK